MEIFKGAIGIPVHSQESEETLRRTLRTITESLGPNPDVPVIVCFNGPNARSLGNSVENYQLQNLTVLYSLEGIVNALTRIAKEAKQKDLQHCIFYDADISPLPDWFEKLASVPSTSKIVLTRYSPFPPEILVAEGRIRPETPNYYVSRILEGDKHPLIRDAIRLLSASGKLLKPARKPRLKGSLVRIDTQSVNFGGQKITSDSVLGFISTDTPWSIAETGFFYMPRTSFEDHLRARLRHYRALNLWGKNVATASESLYPKQDLLTIRDFVLSINNDDISAKEAVGYFLLREAFREETMKRLVKFLDCSASIDQQREFQGSTNSTAWVDKVVDFLNSELDVNRAFFIINQIFEFDINWPLVFGSKVSQGLGITQFESAQDLVVSKRTPIDLRPYLKNKNTRQLLSSWLNLEI